MNGLPDAWIRVFDKDGGAVSITIADQSALDHGVSECLNGRDSLLYLRLIDGDEFIIPASRISNWMVSTKEGRKRTIALEAAMDEEKQQNRQDAGLWGDPDA